MDAYSLTAVIVITLGSATVACVHLVTKAGRGVSKDVAETARAPIDAGERVAVKTLDTTETVAVTTAVTAGVVATRTVAAGEAVVTHAIEAALATAEPLTKGVADICRAIAGRIESKRSELGVLREQIAKLAEENERLRNRQIRVDQIKQIFQIAFFECEVSERDVVKKVVREEAGGMVARQEQIEYLGVFRGRNTQKIGVDMDDLRFSVVSPSVVAVSGLGKTKLIGNINTDVDEEFIELRRHLCGVRMLPDSHEILSKDIDIDGLKKNAADEQRRNFEKALKQEKRIKQIEQGVEMMTLQLLKDHFSARGYEVVKATDELVDPKSIFEIQEVLNAKVQAALEDNSRRLAEAKTAHEVTEKALQADVLTLKSGDFSKLPLA